MDSVIRLKLKVLELFIAFVLKQFSHI